MWHLQKTNERQIKSYWCWMNLLQEEVCDFSFYLTYKGFVFVQIEKWKIVKKFVKWQFSVFVEENIFEQLKLSLVLVQWMQQQLHSQILTLFQARSGITLPGQTGQILPTYTFNHINQLNDFVVPKIYSLINVLTFRWL